MLTEPLLLPLIQRCQLFPFAEVSDGTGFHLSAASFNTNRLLKSGCIDRPNPGIFNGGQPIGMAVTANSGRAPRRFVKLTEDYLPLKRSRHWRPLALLLILGWATPLRAGQSQPAGLASSDPEFRPLMERRDYDGLDRAYAEALRQQPGDYRLTYNRALANYFGGHLERARDLLLTTKVSDRETTEYQTLLATVLVQLGDFREALPPAIDVVRLNPSDPDNWLRLGALYLRLRKGQHALNTYQAAAERFPNRPEFLIGRGVVEEMVARMPLAIQVYRQVIQKFPNYEPGYQFLGQVQVKAGLPSDARRTAQLLLRLNPHSAYGEYLLAQADWITPGKAQEARPHLQRALELNPRLAEAALLAGKVELQAGQPAKAIPILKQAIQSEPRLEEGHFLLAKAHQQNGDKKQAEVELATFQKLRQAEEKENHLLSNFLATGEPRP